MLKCFGPIVDKNAKVLILGSMPGKESLKMQQYYAYRRNHFWEIICSIFDESVNDDYKQKIIFLKEHGLALWDVINSCEREGSLDANIRNEEINDFTLFLKQYPNIKHVCFNGAKAESSFKKYIGFNRFNGIKFYRLPSTSPANTQHYDQKIAAWKIIRTLIEQY
ncbi:DNA-deoxyinosine glycosylase [Petroclostridium sp. X23]|uniref:DNA-deoxyinosine glycosylase n=1 Tax=Petroclostridium sp. X23 TaxID=3045146 RepID=UPI0024AE0004|nr:DNA-deoxyinosine glycosylase [Petroclostridium sp. X23]WHH60297.1 DNA-deoxyinosine glycosylase [Petroclostridium sp. X23]